MFVGIFEQHKKRPFRFLCADSNQLVGILVADPDWRPIEFGRHREGKRCRQCRLSELLGLEVAKHNEEIRGCNEILMESLTGSISAMPSTYLIANQQACDWIGCHKDAREEKTHLIFIQQERAWNVSVDLTFQQLAAKKQNPF